MFNPKNKNKYCIKIKLGVKREQICSLFFLLLLAIVALLTIVAEELGALSNAVTHLFEITTAIVTSIMAFKE